MLNMFLSLISIGILVYLMVVLLLRAKVKKNQYLIILNFALFYSFLAAVLKFISERVEKLSFLMNYNYSGAIAAVFTLVLLLIFVLIRKERLDHKIIYFILFLGILIIFIFGFFSSVIGLFFTPIVIILSFILTVLSFLIYFFNKQKGGLYFIAYVLTMIIAGSVVSYSETLRLVFVLIAYFLLAFGVLRFNENKENINAAEVIFGKASKNIFKISSKIILIFSGLFIIVIIIEGFIISSLAGRYFKNISYEQIKNINSVKNEQIRTFLRSEKEVVSILAASTVFRDFLSLSSRSDNYLSEKERTFQRLNRSINLVEQITEIFILDNNGKIVVSTDEIKEGQDKSGDSYFLEGQKGLFIKSPYYSESVNANIYTVSAPIRDDITGELLGVVVVRMDPKNLYDIIGSIALSGETGESFLIDKDLYFLTPSRFLGEKVILIRKINTQNARDCFAEEEVNASKSGDYLQHIGHEGIKNYIDYRNVRIIGTHSYVPDSNWCLITKIDESEVLAPGGQIVSKFFLICFGALIFFFFVGILVSRIIVKPINKLYEGTKIIEEGNLDFKIENNSQDEIGDLSRSFNKMAATLKKSRLEIENKVENQTYEIILKTEKLDNQQMAILSVLEDVKKEKIKSDLLAHDLDKFKLAVEDASDHIAITDLEGKIIYANKGVEKITGFSRDKVIGQKAGSKENWGGLMDPIFYQKLWKTIKENKEVFSGEINNRRISGEDYIAFASISPVLDENKNIIFFVGIERDITKERQIDKTKTEFVSLASHQLRTPLSATNWYTEMLLAGDAGKISKKQKQYLEEIYHSNKRMVELVSSLLNVSRLDLGTFYIEPKPTDIIKIADNVLKELSSEINTKKIKIKKDYDKTIAEINVDQKLTTIIFQNLLSNAVKYNNEKGTVTLAIKKQDQNILITVSDNGYGIPEKDQARIFTKLFRADNAREKETDGTGLGLYIIKSIMEQSGGKIWFESKKDQGTTFYVTIPLSGMKTKEGTKGLG